MFMLANAMQKKEAEKLDDKWIFESKFDGERAMIFIEQHKISRIINRTGNNILKQFVEFKELSFEFESATIDSEIIVIVNGRIWGDFNRGIALRNHLQNEQEILQRSKELRAKIMAFDMLNIEGRDLRYKPLFQRKELLRECVKSSDLIEVVSECSFKELWEIVEQNDLEGVMAKHRASAYESVRSAYWLKIKNFKEKVVVFDSYEVVSGERFYKGITLTNKEGVRCACLGKKADEVKDIIDRTGRIDVVIQYLEQLGSNPLTPSFRFITFKEIAK